MSLEKFNSEITHQAQLTFQAGCELLQQGKQEDADELFEQAHRLNPNNIDVLNLLGIRYYQKKDYENALHFLNRANKLAPGSAQTLGNLGLTKNALSDFTEALHFLDLAIINNPSIPEIHNNRGNALKGLQKNAEAITAYTKAISLRPNYAEALSNKGVLLLEAGEFTGAISFFELAIQANPNFAAAFNNLGNALTHIESYDQAFQCYERALQINPHYLDALLNFGGSLKKSKQFYPAIECYQHALTLDLGNAKTYHLLGEIYYDIGDVSVAKAHYEKSLALDPTNLETQLALTISQIPKVYENQQEIIGSRVSFNEQLALLEANLKLKNNFDICPRLISKHPFYLAYQDDNNRSLLEQFGKISTLLASPIQSLIPTPRIQRSGKIRLGIVSNYFCDHPVWHAITKGWVTHLDSEIFEICIFNTNGTQDSETEYAKSKATHYYDCGNQITKAAEIIYKKNVDILLYPELGMDTTSRALACLRLSPIQATSWGHPETSGLPTIDFYFSGELFEPENAEDLYTEKLIKLPDFGNSIEVLSVKSIRPNLQKLGLHKDSPILICAGSPSKYLPINDHALVELAKGLESCQFVFFNFEEHLTNQLMKRLDAAFSSSGLNANDYIKPIPFLSREEFFGLMLESDLYLDTIGFSGFNTALQAVSCDLPVITIEGNHMRGRLASAILRKLNLPEYICINKTTYVDLAINLIKNQDYLAAYKKSIKDYKNTLLNTLISIQSLEDFLIKQVKKETSKNS